MKQPLLIIAVVLCGAIPAGAQTGNNYTQQVQAWRRQRMENLKAENGWLNLAGLFWLEAGRNSVGSGKSNKIVFPQGKSPLLLGHFVLEKSEVLMEIVPGAKVTAGGKPVVSPLRLYPADTQTVLQSGSLRWFVVKRGERYAVRLRDLEHPALQHFTGVDAYPVDSVWRVRARLEPAAADKKIPITNVLGQVSLQVSPGTLVFDLQGATCRLDAVQEDGKLFVLFSDHTNGVETYGTGRFLYADMPDETGHTVLDFNYAINPPCAFTDFATCPLPPRQNALPLSVTAGEKKTEGH